MKYRYLLIGFLSTLALSCTVSEIDAPEGPGGYSSPKGDVFYVSIDEQPEAETKVYADTSLRVLWNFDDRVSIFNRYTYNWEYQFKDKDGSNSGIIDPIGERGEGDTLDFVYSVYPYQETTSITTAGAISFEMPTVQYYKENSFGIGANTMVSKTDDNKLKFKNVGGYLALKMYGSNVKVSSIILRGNNNEILSGPSTIVMTDDGPSVSLSSTSADYKQIRLYCKEVVELGSSPNTEDCTIFWIVVPPVEFTKGFKVTVATPDGKTYTKSTSKPFTINRSTVTRLAPFYVDLPETGADIRINGISSNAGGYGIDVTESNGSSVFYNTAIASNDTLTITLPTVTDFSNLVLNYDLVEGDILIVNGKKVTSGVPIDASGPSDNKYKSASRPVSLTVWRGDAEKRFTLVARNTGLPIVRIKTTGFTQADLDSKQRKKKVGTTTIDEREWKPTDEEIAAGTATAEIVVEYPDGSIDTEAPTQIKGRGNVTWDYKKKPYALRLKKENKANILGLMKKGSHRRWVLLANWKDRTLLRNDAAFWLSKQTDLDFTVNGTFVELDFNGIHRGNYYLCEQVKIDKNRVAIDDWDPVEDSTATVTGGFLMEIDNNYDEEFKFTSNSRTGLGLKYMFKDPDSDISDAAFSYMEDFVNTMERQIKNASRNDNYLNYFDIESAIWFMFVNELTGNGDFFNDGGSAYYGPHSTYLYKDKEKANAEGIIPEKSKKMHMGPVWDFDYLTFVPGRSSEWVGVNHSGYYFYYLRNNKAFCDKTRELWESYREKIDTELLSYIDGMADKISLSEEFNTKMWGYNGQDQEQNGDNTLGFRQAVKNMKDAFSTKYGYMNTNLYNTSFLKK